MNTGHKLLHTGLYHGCRNLWLCPQSPVRRKWYELRSHSFVRNKYYPIQFFTFNILSTMHFIPRVRVSSLINKLNLTHLCAKQILRIERSDSNHTFWSDGIDLINHRWAVIWSIFNILRGNFWLTTAGTFGYICDTHALTKHVIWQGFARSSWPGGEHTLIFLSITNIFK